MISICIPVYNFNIATLVTELSEQANSLNIPYEIIVIDDCSQAFKEENKSICELNDAQYIELEENIGRSKIRNLFLNYATFDYFLFLDCDSLVKNLLFLLNYVETIKNSPSVVCGGRVYDEKIPPRSQMLSWKYGTHKESQPCEARVKTPNKSFMTNNFMVDRKVLEEIKFDERITKYGHEDTLFGFSLKKKNITIAHIENPVINGDVEENSVFLNKTRTGIINLIQILDYIDYDKKLINEISILKFYKKIKKFEGIINLSFIFLKPFIVFPLRTGYVNLNLFDFYKLGILIEILREPMNKKVYKRLKSN